MKSCREIPGRCSENRWTRHPARSMTLLLVIVIGLALVYGLVHGFPRPAADTPEHLAEEADSAPEAASDAPVVVADALPLRSSTGAATEALADVLERIVVRDFWEPEEVATGRFLRNFELHADLLDGIDFSRAGLIRRGLGWALLEFSAPWSRGVLLEIRVVRRVDGWKLENLRITRRSTGVPDASL